jgi:hypothetical protein
VSSTPIYSCDKYHQPKASECLNVDWLPWCSDIASPQVSAECMGNAPTFSLLLYGAAAGNLWLRHRGPAVGCSWETRINTPLKPIIHQHGVCSHLIVSHRSNDSRCLATPHIAVCYTPADAHRSTGNAGRIGAPLFDLRHVLAVYVDVCDVPTTPKGRGQQRSPSVRKKKVDPLLYVPLVLGLLFSDLGGFHVPLLQEPVHIPRVFQGIIAIQDVVI